METLEPIAVLIWFAWVVLTIWSIIQIIKLVWPVLKDDWFWFASKAGYYKGFGFALIWFIPYGLLSAFLGWGGHMLGILIQVGVVYFIHRGKSPSKLEKAVWLSIPFFMLPLWLAYKQGVRNGELLPAPNP